MAFFLMFISALALLISKIALIVFLIYTFLIEMQSQDIEEVFVSRETRKIKKPPKDESQLKIEIKKTLLRKTTLFWTMIIGEIVGYIFMTLSQHQNKFEVLACNAVCLLFGSLLCQMLTVINAWLKKKMNLLFRLQYQIGFALLGGILISIVISQHILWIFQYLLLFVLAYFFTVILAILSILIDALIAEKGKYFFDYNHYSRLVILIGLVIGTSFTFIFLQV